MKWYKFNIINKSVAVIALAIVLFIIYGTSGPWDFYFYLLIGGILLCILLIDFIVQGIKQKRP